MPSKLVRRLGTKGQVGIPQILSMIILIFVVFTVGRILFNATALDADTSDGGIGTNGISGAQAGVVANPLMNIGLITMSGIIIIAAFASVVIRFF